MDRSHRILLGTRKGVLQFRRNGSGWQLESTGHPGLHVAFATQDPRTGTLWTGVETGHWGPKLYASRDDGASWAPVGQPSYPEGAEIRAGVPATLRYPWVIQPSTAAEPGVVYLGTEPGGLFRSSDDGETWTLVESLWNHPSRQAGQWFGGGRDEAGIHSILINPQDPRHILVGISCAGVFETRDGGDTWHPRNRGLAADFLPSPDVEVGHDPHFVAAGATDFNQLWQQNHCGIFRSRDGAATWDAVSQKGNVIHFGFAVAVDERNPEVAWVVPADSDQVRLAPQAALCVGRTDDGGRSWKELRYGLPQENAFDVTYRHALDAVGDSVAFGTTTGNVYISDDRGEHWQALGNNLPPVHSLRFIR